MMQGMIRRVSLCRAIAGSGLVLGVCLLALGQAVGSAARQEPAGSQSIDVEHIGPKIGAALPEFSLHDQDGKVHSLKSLLGTNGAVIVFFRSADW